MMLELFKRNSIWAMSPILGLTTAISCGGTGVSEPEAGPIEQVDGTRLVVGDYRNLTDEEFENYKEDIKYVNNLTQRESEGRGYLNLADDRQRRFVMARLKISGKTRDNSPQLFKVLQETREEHARLAYGDRLVPKISFRNGEDGRDEQHFVSEFDFDLAQGTAVVNSTFPDATDMTYLDAMPTDDAGAPIGTTTSTDEYGNGTDVRSTTFFDPNNSPTARIGLSSMKMDVVDGGLTVSYLNKMMGPEDAAVNARLVTAMVFQNMNAPVDVDGLGDIQVCLDRTWPGDCDYDLTSTPQAVKLPLQGSIHIAIPGDMFSADTIAAIKADANNHPRAGHLKLNLTNSGGGCDVDADGDLVAEMQDFWDHVQLTDGNTTLTWDLTGPNSAFFDDGCRQVQDLVFLNLSLDLPWIRTSEPAAGVNWFSMSVSSIDQGTAAPGTYVIPNPIYITNSCLAAGTMIQMADGSTRPIEEVASGDHVFNSFHDGAKGLTVTATAVGFEPIPMIRLEADSGHSALMTEKHPVMTPDRGIVFARDLEQGDLVVTMNGVSTVAKAAREDYDGKVYNLKVGDALEKAALGGDDRTLVYADGFLVGDGQIQTKHEFEHIKARTSGDVLERLPEEWHRDYSLSPIRQRQ